MFKRVFFSTFLLNFIINQVLFSQYSFKKFAGGMPNPVAIENCGDSRLFVVERKGKIRIIDKTGQVLSQPFLDISPIVKSVGGEQGLLGLAFSPNYKNDKCFYVYYTDTSETQGYDCSIAVARYKESGTNANVADSLSGEVILKFLHPYGNHNGGCLKFGADGYLYISTGDGGSGGDPFNSGQTLSSLLGKMLRIDVNIPTSYQIPTSNPFINDTSNKPEIYHYGLRNPWRFSFDRLTNDMWIGDVGQNQIEEIDRCPLSASGLNFGWRCYEGNALYDFSLCDSFLTYASPVYQYTHSIGCSVTGGVVYRGALATNMYGNYFYSDYCGGTIRKLTTDTPYVQAPLISTGKNVVAFGENCYGEIYIASLGDSSVYHFYDTTACRPVPVVYNKPDSIYYCGDSLLLSFLPYNPSLHYTWYLSDSVIENPNAEKNIFYAKTKGAYKVMVAKTDTCFVVSDSLLVHACVPTSYSEALNLYPNPVKNAVNIEFTCNEPQQVQVLVFDMHAHKIKDLKLLVTKGFNSISIPLYGTAKGMYALQLISKEKTHRQKFEKW